MRVIDCRKPTSISELDATQRMQLELAWLAYCGDEVGAEELISESPGWFELWRFEGFDFWHCPPDGGCVFVAGEATAAGIEMIQFSFDGPGGEPLGGKKKKLRDALSTAWEGRSPR